MYYVYILISLKDNRTYVGYTKNLNRRLKDHNYGMINATKYRKPLEILFSEKFLTIKEAKSRELWWKSSNGRKKLKEYFMRRRSSVVRASAS
ncbi:GIY-YIG nuclease family protein [Candidatus Wolfebacteria bacterium]|nr:GIY-YIG nuclease family protein [Candidatus Wolfebacteria bacterium]